MGVEILFPFVLGSVSQCVVKKDLQYIIPWNLPCFVTLCYQNFTQKMDDDAILIDHPRVYEYSESSSLVAKIETTWFNPQLVALDIQ